MKTLKMPKDQFSIHKDIYKINKWVVYDENDKVYFVTHVNDEHIKTRILKSDIKNI